MLIKINKKIRITLLNNSPSKKQYIIDKNKTGLELRESPIKKLKNNSDSNDKENNSRNSSNSKIKIRLEDMN
jgi:hypothetical protein